MVIMKNEEEEGKEEKGPDKTGQFLSPMASAEQTRLAGPDHIIP
jgi:hypothetical protein